jgi:uncharacterized protein YegL
MNGEPIRQLNEGLVAFRDELLGDDLAAKRVEVAIVTFGPVRTLQGFQTATSFSSPQLHVEGDTPMGAAVVEGLRLLAERKSEYKANGIAYYRPWVFLITDGAPTDSIVEASRLVRTGEQERSFAFFAVGVEGANIAKLSELAQREPLMLKGLRFRELFQWLSTSMKAVSRSTPGDAVPLETPVGPNGWAEIK